MRFAVRYALLLLLFITAAPAHAQSFTYQGKLSTTSGPANTPHDFQFRIFTLSAGGVQVGSTTTQLNLPVTDGVFTASVSPGATVFTGSDRWLEVAVRPVGSPTYTTLAPRQRIAAAPYAARSLSERLVDIGGGVLTNNGPVDGSTINRLILNRTTPVTGADYFTVRTPTGQQQFGGMYIDTAAGDGYPFYGFATGGSVRSYAYVDGTNGAFKLSVGGDRVTVSNTGLVGVGTEPTGPERLQVAGAVKATGTITASNVAYTAPQTRTLYIEAEQFVSGTRGVDVWLSATAGQVTLNSSSIEGSLVAPISLPEGAVITFVQVWCRDNSAGADLTASFVQRSRFANFSTELGTATTTGVNPLYQLLIPGLPSDIVTDVDSNSYAIIVSCNSWQHWSTMVANCRVDYTVPAPD